MLARIAFGLLAAGAPALAAISQTFSRPAPDPATQSSNYTGAANKTLDNGPVVTGKVFDQFIQVWLENTDFATAASSATFQKLAKQGISLTNFYALTHPSEPNYAAVVGGDFWGMGDDAFYAIPSNISTVVDLLEDKKISWAMYQENLPFDGYTGFNFSSKNYLNTSAPDYVYYVRKHNPVAFYDSVMGVESRGLRVRNFNDFALDLNNQTLPQWIFVTPNMVNDAHDTTIEFTADWLEFWLVPLLSNPKFNTNRTLVLLTFDESESAREGNRIFTLLLGGAVPEKLKGTNDTTYFTHYSALSTVQANWELGSLGRQDTNKTMANVFTVVADAANFTNTNVTNPPQNSASGTIPGPLNPQFYVPFAAPDTSAVGAGGGPVFMGQGLNMTITTASLPAPVNLTGLGQMVPSSADPGFDYSSGSLVTKPPQQSGTTTKASDARATAAVGITCVFAALFASAAIML